MVKVIDRTLELRTLILFMERFMRQTIISILLLALSLFNSDLIGAIEVEKLNVEFTRILNIKNALEKEELSLNPKEFEEKYLSIEKDLLKLYTQSAKTELGAKVLMELGNLYQYKLVDYKKAIKVFSKIIKKYPKSYYPLEVEIRLEQSKKDFALIQKNLSLLRKNPKQEIAAPLLLEIARIYSNNAHRAFKARQAYWEVYKRYPTSKEAAYALYELLIRGIYYKDSEEGLDIGILIIEGYPDFEEYENSKLKLIDCFLDESISTEKLKQVYETSENSFVKAMSLFGLAKKNRYNEEGINLIKKIDEEFSNTGVADDALADLAIHYYLKNDLENYKRILSLIEKRYPNATDILDSYDQYEWIPALMLGYGELLFRVEKNAKKAIEAYQEVIKRYPDSKVITDFSRMFSVSGMFGVAGAEAQKEIAEIYAEQGEYEKAVLEYKKLVLEFPESIRGQVATCDMTPYGEVGLSEIVKIYKDNLKNQEALHNLMKEIIAKSNSGVVLAYCYNHLAGSALTDKDPKTAVAYYKKSALFDLYALEKIPQICITEINNPLLAIEALEEIRDNSQDNIVKGCATYWIGKIYYDELKDFIKGAKFFKEFIINYPDGVGHEMEGPYYGAGEPLEKMIIFYREKGDYKGLRQELCEIFERCKSLNITAGVCYTITIEPNVLFTIAESFEKESNKTEAIKTYKKLINQYPLSEEAKEAMKKLKIK